MITLRPFQDQVRELVIQTPSLRGLEHLGDVKDVPGQGVLAVPLWRQFGADYPEAVTRLFDIFVKRLHRMDCPFDDRLLKEFKIQNVARGSRATQGLKRLEEVQKRVILAVPSEVLHRAECADTEASGYHFPLDTISVLCLLLTHWDEFLALDADVSMQCGEDLYFSFGGKRDHTHRYLRRQSKPFFLKGDSSAFPSVRLVLMGISTC